MRLLEDGTQPEESRTAATVMPGEMAEWLMAPVLKTGIPEKVSGVRIPLSPPYPNLLRFRPSSHSLLCVPTRIGIHGVLKPSTVSRYLASWHC